MNWSIYLLSKVTVKASFPKTKQYFQNDRARQRVKERKKRICYYYHVVRASSLVSLSVFAAIFLPLLALSQNPTSDYSPPPLYNLLHLTPPWRRRRRLIPRMRLTSKTLFLNVFSSSRPFKLSRKLITSPFLLIPSSIKKKKSLIFLHFH